MGRRMRRGDPGSQPPTLQRRTGPGRPGLPPLRPTGHPRNHPKRASRRLAVQFGGQATTSGSSSSPSCAVQNGGGAGGSSSEPATRDWPRSPTVARGWRDLTHRHPEAGAGHWPTCDSAAWPVARLPRRRRPDVRPANGCHLMPSDAPRRRSLPRGRACIAPSSEPQQDRSSQVRQHPRPNSRRSTQARSVDPG